MGDLFRYKASVLEKEYNDDIIRKLMYEIMMKCRNVMNITNHREREEIITLIVKFGEELIELGLMTQKMFNSLRHLR